MTDIVEFLRAQLDADEAAARAVLQRNRWAPAPNGDMSRVDDGEAWVAMTSDAPGSLPGRVADHIARHDPARVLADVAAKRAIVDEHSPPPPPRDGEAGWVGCFACIEFAHEPEPCRTLRLLAQSYEGAPGWDPAWKVET